jgi:NADP-dependent aldehyde dehydrogenase
MQLTGQQFLGFTQSKEGISKFHAVNPSTGEALPTDFIEATSGEIDAAIQKAEDAFGAYRKKTGKEKAGFLDQIGEEIMALGDDLIQRCMKETGLPEARLQGERGRTVNQLKLFAELLREGSWVDARIDTAIPDRQTRYQADENCNRPRRCFWGKQFPFGFFCCRW